jgi:nitroimidazol reductase NimA-like FMN-containing flavoprotein (pyridoxamine 5'-phosphate oxidase superfamily)
VKKWMGDEAWELFDKAFYGRLALSVDDQPYIVPVNYALEGRRIYIHCANQGRKLEAIRANPKVCFEISEPEKLVKGENLCQYGVRYWSILAFGTAAIVTDAGEKLAALELLGKKYGGETAPPVVDPEKLHLVTVIRLAIDELTGKRNVDKPD